jgi:2-polyprenyl-6-methoxyphenol hydroxylase-like FAD-dependent oxidoreductase
MPEVQVLIVGAGPTGLVLALWLTRLGIRVRIIDKTAEPGTTSRALVVHARTLEFYRQIGLAHAIVEAGLEFAAVNLWVRGRKAARIALGALGAGLTPFPYMLIYPQDQHERLLIERLAASGVAVERQTALLGFEDEGGQVLARLRRPDGMEETCAADYLAGCDGARSAVRGVIGTGFPGGTYADLYYVADVQARGPVVDGELHVALDDADFLAVFPLQGTGRARLISTVRQDARDQHAQLAWEDVSPRILARMGITIDQVNWFSTYHVHHRVAARFRGGRAFLLGDAAHIHSPVGGQGMNTGIGDAVNLGWKLAAVLAARADPRLLDTYEPERIAFARRLVATTDRAFTLISSRGPIAQRVRVQVVPRVLPALFRFKAMRRLMFRTVSQTAVNYHASTLSLGAAGRVRGGDRLPWVQPGNSSDEPGGNFAPLTALDWQVHVYGRPTSELVASCRERELPLHAFPWRPEIRRTGLRRDAAYLVRPDGYVALADPKGGAARLESYLDDRGLRPLNATRSRAPSPPASSIVEDR